MASSLTVLMGPLRWPARWTHSYCQASRKASEDGRWLRSLLLLEEALEIPLGNGCECGVGERHRAHVSCLEDGAVDRGACVVGLLAQKSTETRRSRLMCHVLKT